MTFQIIGRHTGFWIRGYSYYSDMHNKKEMRNSKICWKTQAIWGSARESCHRRHAMHESLAIGDIIITDSKGHKCVYYIDSLFGLKTWNPK